MVTARVREGVRVVCGGERRGEKDTPPSLPCGDKGGPDRAR